MTMCQCINSSSYFSTCVREVRTDSVSSGFWILTTSHTAPLVLLFSFTCTAGRKHGDDDEERSRASYTSALTVWRHCEHITAETCDNSVMKLNPQISLSFLFFVCEIQRWRVIFYSRDCARGGKWRHDSNSRRQRLSDCDSTENESLAAVVSRTSTNWSLIF